MRSGSPLAKLAPTPGASAPAAAGKVSPSPTRAITADHLVLSVHLIAILQLLDRRLGATAKWLTRRRSAGRRSNRVRHVGRNTSECARGPTERTFTPSKP